MSELKEFEINLAEVVEKYKLKNVEITEQELLEIEERGGLRVFSDKEACFFWVNDTYDSLADVVETWLQKSPQDFEPYETILDYALKGKRFAVLDDGEVVFLYEA